MNESSAVEIEVEDGVVGVSGMGAGAAQISHVGAET